MDLCYHRHVAWASTVWRSGHPSTSFFHHLFNCLLNHQSGQPHCVTFFFFFFVPSWEDNCALPLHYWTIKPQPLPLLSTSVLYKCIGITSRGKGGGCKKTPGKPTYSLNDILSFKSRHLLSQMDEFGSGAPKGLRSSQPPCTEQEGIFSEKKQDSLSSKKGETEQEGSGIDICVWFVSFCYFSFSAWSTQFKPILLGERKNCWKWLWEWDTRGSSQPFIASPKPLLNQDLTDFYQKKMLQKIWMQYGNKGNPHLNLLTNWPTKCEIWACLIKSKADIVAGGDAQFFCMNRNKSIDSFIGPPPI